MLDSFSPKERFLKAINHDEPDRVPIYFTITSQVAERLSQHLGIPEYTHPDSPHTDHSLFLANLTIVFL